MSSDIAYSGSCFGMVSGMDSGHGFGAQAWPWQGEAGDSVP